MGGRVDLRGLSGRIRKYEKNEPDEAFLHWGISGTYINNQSEITFFIVFLCILCIFAETVFKARYGGRRGVKVQF